MADYRLILTDVKTDTVRAEIPMLSGKLSLELNRVEGFVPVVPLSLTRTIDVPRPYRETIKSLNPWAYWRLGETSGTVAADEMGLANGAYIGGASVKLGQQGALTGDTNRSMTIAATIGGGVVAIPSTIGNHNPPWTFSVWYKDSTPFSGDRTIWNKGVASTSLLIKMNALGQIILARADNGTTITRTTNAIILDGLWHHLSISKAGNAVGQTVVKNDDVVMPLNADTAYNFNTAVSSVAGLGARWTGAASTQNWGGDLDEVSWHPTVWTDEENTMVYQSGRGVLETYKSTYQVVNRETIDPGKTSCYLIRNGEVVWGGMLWACQPNPQKNTLELKCSGFLSYYWRRLLRYNKVWLAVDQLEMARRLALEAATEGVNITIPGSFPASGVLRDRTWYWYEGQILGDLIEKLSQCIDGFDFGMEFSWNGNEPAKTFRCYYPQRGVGLADAQLLWTFAAPGQGGALLLDLKAPKDASGSSNLLYETGATIGVMGINGTPVLNSTAQDSNLLDQGYPSLQTKTAYSDVTVQETLDEHVQGDLARSKIIPQPITARLRPDNVATDWDAWGIGDCITVRGEHGWLAIDDVYRLLKADVTIDAQAEQINVTLAQPAKEA